MENKIVIILVTINIIAAIISKIYLILWVLKDSKIRVNKQFFIISTIIFIILNSFLGMIFYLVLRRDSSINCMEYFKNIIKYKNCENCLNKTMNINAIRKIQIQNLRYLKFGVIYFLVDLSITTLLALKLGFFIMYFFLEYFKN